MFIGHKKYDKTGVGAEEYILNIFVTDSSIFITRLTIALHRMRQREAVNISTIFNLLPYIVMVTANVLHFMVLHIV